ncbi:MAG: hypothetical protein ABI645_05725 [Pseudomonadota bacterium]
MKLGLLAGAALFALVGCNQDVASAEAPDAVAPSAQAQAQAQAQAAAGAPATASGDSPVSSMQLAEPPQKLGAPVELRYQFDGDVNAGQPVTLHLAAVPLVAGSNLSMSIKKESGLSTTTGALTAQKVSAATAYRQELSVTKLAGGPSELHVLVTMDVPEGSAHSWFNIRFDGAEAAGKLQPIKQE